MVLILPMRNGNNLESIHFVSPPVKVLILPMRNGNFFAKYRLTLSTTRSYPTYEEWKLISIANLMSLTSVLILPMRNGNFLPSIYYYRRCVFRSYPTYEEWKLCTLL